MKVQKLGRGRIEFNFRHEGNRVRQVVPLDELTEWLLARQNHIFEGHLGDRVGPKGAISLKDFSEQYYKDFAQTHQPKSWRSEWNRVRVLVELMGRRLVHEIGVRDYDAIAEYGRIRSLRPATINHMALRLSNMLRAARELGLIRHDSVLPSFPRLKPNNERDRILLDREILLLIAHARHPVMRAMIVVALNTGMRRSELAKLQWSEVDLDGGWIHVRRTKNGRPREVPINSKVREVLAALPIPMQDGPVFEVGASWISHEFKRVAKAAGLSDICFHDTRRTFISNALRLGVPQDLVRRIVGHQTSSQVARYAVFDGSFTKSSIEKLATAHRSGQKSGHTHEPKKSEKLENAG